jgi:hypothetical protein
LGDIHLGRDEGGWLDRLEAQHRGDARRAGALEREQEALQVARCRDGNMDALGGRVVPTTAIVAQTLSDA